MYLAGTQPLASVVSTALVALPLVRAAGSRGGGARVLPVFQVVTESASPASRTEVFVHARSGQVVATREDLRFLTGSLHYQAPVRGPQTHADFPARARTSSRTTALLPPT